jgi:DNA-directed RNA polymerase specialized sigma24 family protein
MPSNIKLSESQLVEEIILRSRKGAEALYDQYSKVLILRIFRHVKHIEETNDIVETVFKEIWNSIDLFKLQQKPFLV